MINSKLLSYEKLRIPEALTLDHEELRVALIRAAAEPGRIGKAAERVANLCLAHFGKEEEDIFRAFGLLHDLASDRARPDMAAMARMIAQFSAQHDALRDHHRSIDAAVENLLQHARKEENKEIAELVFNLRDHEKIENEVPHGTANCQVRAGGRRNLGKPGRDW